MKNLKKYLYFLLLGVVVFLVYYNRLTNEVISIDTESFINNPTQVINSWYSIGRFSLGAYIKLFNLLPLNIFLNNVISLLLYFISTILLVRSFNKKEMDYKKIFLCSLLILTSPLLVEQYAFTLQNIEVSLSYLLLVFVMLGLNKAIYDKKYIYYFLTPLLVLIFGTYQSFYLMYITLSIIYFLEHYNKKVSFKEHVKNISSYIGILLIFIFLTTIVGKIINHVLEIDSTGYLLAQMNWFNGDFIKGILYSGYYFVEVLLGLGIDNNLGFTILIILVFFHLKKEAKNESLIYKLANILLLVSPFLITILFGTLTFNRAQFSIPIILAYLYGKFLKNKKVFLLVIVLILVQSISSSYLFFIDLERYQNDIELMNRVEKIENNKKLPLIFIGNVSYERMISGEVLGKSFYNWDYKTERLSNDRISGFMNAKGFYYSIPNLEQIIEVRNHQIEYQNFITYEDEYIVVNLNMYNN